MFSEKNKVCSMCAEALDLWDERQGLFFDRSIGYGSKYDMHRIRLALCCRCFDRVVDWIRPQCKHDPMTEC